MFAPSGAVPGSIEGLVYTKLPLWFRAISLPEILLQTQAFSWLLVRWDRRTAARAPRPSPAA
ncbi:MAG TPA: hypothetical protein VJ300_03700 [Thermoplasmata archaeon]|nr:hypothetical protein [Thermoplasmata archaeon]